MHAVVFGFLLLASCVAASGSPRPVPDEFAIVSPNLGGSVFDLRGRALSDAQAVSGVDSLEAAPNDRNLRQHSDVLIGTGDFALRATVVIDDMSSRGAGISLDGGSVLLDDREWGAVLVGRLFGGGRFPFETQRPTSARPGAPIEVEISRYEGSLAVKLNDFEMGRIGMRGFALGRIGFDLAAGNMRVLECSVEGDASRFPLPRAAFSSADGEIDEYRDPSVASDGTRGLVTAIAVQTIDDGTTRDTLYGRFVERDGRMSDPHAIDLGGATVEIAVIGFARGQDRPWKLLIQERSEKRVADHLTVFDSSDGQSFKRSDRIEAAGTPIRLLTGAMTDVGGALVASATTARAGVPRASAVRYSLKEGWTVVELSEEPGCEPFWLEADRILVRTPGALERKILVAGARGPTSGFEAGPVALGLVFTDRSVTRLTGADSAFPYPLQEIVSRDRGATWSKGRTIWGGSASNSCSVESSGTRLLVFEGGDRARREHILVLRLGASEANPPVKAAPPSGTETAIPAREPPQERRSE